METVMLRLLMSGALALVLCACDNSETTSQGPGGEDKTRAEAVAAYETVIEKVSRAYFSSSPEVATYNSAPDELAPGADAQLTDRSPTGEEARRAVVEAIIADLKGVDASHLDANRARIIKSLITLFDGAAAPARIAEYGSIVGWYGVVYLPYAINQNSGPTIDIPNTMVGQHAVDNEADAGAYIARLEAIPMTLDGALEKF